MRLADKVAIKKVGHIIIINLRTIAEYYTGKTFIINKSIRMNMWEYPLQIILARLKYPGITEDINLGILQLVALIQRGKQKWWE